MQSRMALTPPAARNHGLEGAPRMGNSRGISTAELWPGLVGQAGGTYVHSAFYSLHLGSVRGRTQYLPPEAAAGPLAPSSPLPQQTKDLGIPESKGWSGCKSHSLELLASGFDLFCVSLCLGH